MGPISGDAEVERIFTMDLVGLAVLAVIFAVALLELWIGICPLKPAPRPG